jgi:hypothetical protein
MNVIQMSLHEIKTLLLILATQLLRYSFPSKSSMSNLLNCVSLGDGFMAADSHGSVISISLTCWSACELAFSF